MIEPSFEDIQNAKKLLRGVVMETPLIRSPTLSKRFESEIYLKLENFQETGSFKERGAYIKLKSLSSDILKRGVITVSAGNHGQAVAFHSHNLQIPATIVMPIFTPPTKVGNTEKWGGRVILSGQTLNESHEMAQKIAEKENLTLIHPYDDPAVIAGQGTIGLEMLESCPELEVLLVPLGGGGLCAGITIVAKHFNPRIKIYGVEVEGYASMSHILYGTKDVKLGGMTLADGIAVKTPGRLPQIILKNQLDGIVIVTEEQIERAVDCFASEQNTIVEGGGAVGLSALFHSPSLFKGKKVGIVVSGGNIDARIISSIMIRGQIHQGRLVHFYLKVEDVPGTLEKVAGIIGRHQGNILEVKHQRLLHEVPIKMAELDIMVETRGIKHIESIYESLKSAGFSVYQFEGSFDGTQ